MNDNLLSAEQGVKPEMLPEKFWDAETGELRLDALIQSYIALERKLSTMMPVPGEGEDKSRLYRLLGVPETHEEYCVNCDHGLFTPDADLNKRLHERGFTPEQVQMVYDLAAEKLVPMILELSGEFKADREVERLAAAFGGPERWQEVSRQLLAFGRKNLSAEVLRNLSSSFEGVMALHRMMKGEDSVVSPRMESPAAESESDLRSMMRDPKYWRQKDPAFIGKVTEGFRRLYAE